MNRNEQQLKTDLGLAIRAADAARVNAVLEQGIVPGRNQMELAVRQCFTENGFSEDRLAFLEALIGAIPGDSRHVAAGQAAGHVRSMFYSGLGAERFHQVMDAIDRGQARSTNGKLVIEPPRGSHGLPDSPAKPGAGAKQHMIGG